MGGGGGGGGEGEGEGEGEEEEEKEGQEVKVTHEILSCFLLRLRGDRSSIL